MSAHVSDRLCRVRLLGLALVLALPGTAHGIDFFFVTNTNNSGAGSLRQAILDANASNDGDENLIQFVIASLGPHSIALTTPLPQVTGSGTLIDGLTQAGSDCSSWPPTLEIELTGSQLGSGSALRLAGNDHLVRGLVINDFPGRGISIDGQGLDGGHRIECNFVGTDISGTLERPNIAGIFLSNTINVSIGGDGAAARNLISGNNGDGITTIAAEDTDIENNYIGTDVLASYAIPNSTGIRIGGVGNTIGGIQGIHGNIIAGNGFAGCFIGSPGTEGTLVIGNRIGVNALNQPIPNGSGVIVSSGASFNAIGTTTSNTKNIIRENEDAGVRVQGSGSLGNSIIGNDMTGNGSIGIELGADSLPIPNDLGDADTGPNNVQNYPDLGSAALDSANNLMLISYGVPSDFAHSLYPLAVDFYIANASGDEGQIYISRHFTGGGFEQISFSFNDIIALAVLGNRILATATDTEGNTSEFSPPIFVPEPATAGTLAVGSLLLAGLRKRRRRFRPAVAVPGTPKPASLKSAC